MSAGPGASSLRASSTAQTRASSSHAAHDEPAPCFPLRGPVHLAPDGERHGNAARRVDLHRRLLFQGHETGRRVRAEPGCFAVPPRRRLYRARHAGRRLDSTEDGDRYVDGLPGRGSQLPLMQFGTVRSGHSKDGRERRALAPTDESLPGDPCREGCRRTVTPGVLAPLPFAAGVTVPILGRSETEHPVSALQELLR